jgi:preprotein translocase subunit SecG
MFGVLAIALQLSAVLQVLLAAFLVTLILMHSGREAGMGGLGFTPHSQGGTHVVERNLTRLTVLVASVFTLNTVLLFHLL